MSQVLCKGRNIFPYISQMSRRICGFSIPDVTLDCNVDVLLVRLCPVMEREINLETIDGLLEKILLVIFEWRLP